MHRMARLLRLLAAVSTAAHEIRLELEQGPAFLRFGAGDDLERIADAFAAKHTSEDNASFEEALERARNAHVRKYWWCYDAERLKAAGIQVPDTSSLGTHLLSDGTRISEERRLKADAAAADEPMASDASQRLLDFAPHEPRNSLLFPPAYEAVNAKPVVKAIQAPRGTFYRSRIICSASLAAIRFKT